MLKETDSLETFDQNFSSAPVELILNLYINFFSFLFQKNVHCLTMPFSVSNTCQPGEEDSQSSDVIRRAMSSDGPCHELHEWTRYDDCHR